MSIKVGHPAIPYKLKISSPPPSLPKGYSSSPQASLEGREKKPTLQIAVDKQMLTLRHAGSMQASSSPRSMPSTMAFASAVCSKPAIFAICLFTEFADPHTSLSSNETHAKGCRCRWSMDSPLCSKTLGQGFSTSALLILETQ